MKLYQTFTSPFPTRVRLVLYAKGIEAEIIEPPGFHSSSESKGDYLAINPIGRVPTLVLDDGRKDGSCIQTEAGRGYRFVAPVTRLSKVCDTLSASSL